MNILKYLKENILFLDGGMGTILQSKGLMPGEFPESWNIKHPQLIKDIHKAYFDAGSNVVNTNTFGANSLKFCDTELEAIISSAIKIAKDAAKESSSNAKKWIALDIGPTGKMLAPYGDLKFEDAIEIFAKTVKLGVKYGADLIFIETMNDSYETKAALLAAKENSELPIFVSNAYGNDGKLMTGASPKSMVAMLEGLGADAIGVNCSLGPRALASVVKEYLEYSSLPVILKPNAGLPKVSDGKTVYNVSPDEFAKELTLLTDLGVRIIGGCCGTTPEYISSAVKLHDGVLPKPIKQKTNTLVSSYTHAVEIGNTPILIGERINPTGKKRLKEAILSQDIDYILKEGVSQQEKGAHILDVNVGLPGISEKAMLTSLIKELQAIIDLPLQIDTSDTEAMESALRCYNGKAMINSVNGKKESMNAIFPLAKKYGGVIVALTLDENGIPENADGRFEIAKKILKEAKRYGINKKDIIFDPLALTVGTNDSAAKNTLRAVELISKKLGCNTSLGVSNVSFGLPCRDLVNSAFFTLALSKGLSAAIINPYSVNMMTAYHTYLALNGQDASCAEYIEFANTLPKVEQTQTVIKGTAASDVTNTSALQASIVKGLKENAYTLTKELLTHTDPLEIVNGEIIPALNKVGEGYEKNTVYLPQLLMSAEAAKSAFEAIRQSSSKPTEASNEKIIIATVKGDIHDIGKNIVKLILENYGFNVIDLGKDVDKETVLSETLKHKASIVGLSALMTTTVPAMEETIRLLKQKAPFAKVIVGGAVLNEEYAYSIGADKYAKDALEAVRYAEKIFEK